MAANSSIEWCEATWNCLAGCEAVSPGCANCYAATMTRRLEAMGQEDYAGLVNAKHFNGVVRCLPHKLDIPLKRRKPTMYFVNSMSDLFHEDVPDEFIAAVFGVMEACPLHTFQILTKRAKRMAEWCMTVQSAGGIGKYIRSEIGRAAIRGMFDKVVRTELVYGKRQRAIDDPWITVFNAAACTSAGPLSNVWLGVSCEDQKRADERIPWLLKTPAAVRFLSCEPLLGGIDLIHIEKEVGTAKGGCPALPLLDWVIVGGESGHGARVCNIHWIRSIVGQCRAAGVPCFVKQLGSKPEEHVSEDVVKFMFPNGVPKGATVAGSYEHHRTFNFADKKGGEPSEWPADLRVRQFPSVTEAV